jgi:hypothetical protein
MDDVYKPQESTADGRAGTDFVISLILMVFSLVVAFWSTKMPRPMGWSTSPGLLPLFLSICIFFMSLSLFISSLKAGGLSRAKAKARSFSFREMITSTKTKRLLWIVLLTAGYMFVLLGRMPFELSSSIFLVSALYVFWRRGGWLKIVLISVIVPVSISALFRVLFIVFVPGESIFDWLLSVLH